jgi:hypothetical protein
VAEGTLVNDSSPLPVHADDAARWPRRYQRVDLVLGQNGDEVDADPRLAAILSESQTTEAPGQGDQEEFLRLWMDAAEARETAQLSPLFSMRALQGAVIANGVALVVLALLMVAPEVSKAGMMASAIVLGLGLMFAAISVVASLNLPGVQLNLARIAAPSWLATASGAVSYAALALAFPLILIAR